MDREELLIVERLKAGDESAYEYLFDKHYGILCHCASQYVGDDFSAEALVCDVIFHLWERRRTLTIGTSLRAYLMAAVRNRCLDELRSRSRLAREDFSETLPFAASDGTPLGLLLENELEREIERCIEGLPDKSREVFLLSRFSEKKYEEIAELLGITVNTVKYHMKQALALLRENLEKYFKS